jgi:hypothetical protein
MAKPKTTWRVIAFASLIAIVLVAAIWLLLGGGFGGGAQQGTTGQPAVAPTAGEGESTPSGSGVDSAAGAADAAHPLQNEAVLAGAVDPSGVELQEGELPLIHERLDALNAAALQRAEEGKMTLQLFLVVPTVEVLVPVSRNVEAPPTLESQVERAVEELIGWTGVEMISPLPEETTVREVWVSPGGIAFVDFDVTLPDNLVGGSLEEIHAVYAVVSTITSSFPEIRSVQILVGGEQADTLDGHVDISRPLLPQYDMVLLDRSVR